MTFRVKTSILLIVLFVLFLSSCFTHISEKNEPDDPLSNSIINQNYRGIENLSDAGVEKAKNTLHIAYQHTSHGSQLITGMDALMNYPKYGSRFAWSESETQNTLHVDDYALADMASTVDYKDLSVGDKEDSNGDTPWVIATRNYLDNPANSSTNVFLWSWCSINGHDAERYVRNMEKLISEYPDVVFVFMTGHAEGQSEDMTPNSVHFNNEYIRTHCRTNNRILFDFAAIEAYNPQGEYFWNRAMQDNLNYNGGNWASEYVAAYPGTDLSLLTTGSGAQGISPCGSCQHSEIPASAKLNCVIKGLAAWNLWVHIAENYMD